MPKESIKLRAKSLKPAKFFILYSLFFWLDCGKAVNKFGKRLVEVLGFYSLYTGLPKYLTSQVFLCAGCTTIYTPNINKYEHPFMCSFNQLFYYLYTLSPAPINTNKYIKDI